MPFRNLFLKELRSILPVFAVFAAAVVLLHSFILYKDGHPFFETEATIVISLVIPFIIASLLAAGTGFFQLHQEWRTNSIYLLLSLPIRGWKVLTAKMGAVLLLLILTLLWIALSFAVILLGVKWDELTASGEVTSTGFLFVAGNAFWMYLLVIIFILALIQFAYLCGQLAAKFKWLVVACSFLAMLWLVLRITPVVSDLLLWMPELILADVNDAEYLRTGSFMALFLISVGLIYLNGYIFESEVEV